MKAEPRFVDLRAFAELSGLPLGWLVREVKTGRIPSIIVGRRRFVSPEDAERILKGRASVSVQEAAHAR